MPPRLEDTKGHKVLKPNGINLVNRSAFVSLWQE